MSSKSITKLLNVRDYVAIDTETTGLDVKWCEMIEVAAVKVVGGIVVDTFDELIQPKDLPIPSFIEKLTGIKSDMLSTARTETEVIPEFREFIGNLPIIGQNVTFDLKFLNASFDRLGLDPIEADSCDLMRLSRILLQDISRHRLADTLQECQKIADTDEDFGRKHRALADTKMTQFCYETLLPILVEKYGDDPDKGYRSQMSAQKYLNGKTFFDGLAPTVESIDDTNPFFQSNVCFTGKLSTLTRKEAWQQTVNLGAIPQKNITKKTDYLVLGSLDFCGSLNGEPSAKLKRAQDLYEKNGAPVIVSEDFFLQFID